MGDQVHEREIVLAAVQQCGDALEFATAMEKNNIEIVTEAISQKVMGYKFASAELRNDPQIIKLALDKSTAETGLTNAGANLIEASRVQGHFYNDYLRNREKYEARRDFCLLLPNKVRSKLRASVWRQARVNYRTAVYE